MSTSHAIITFHRADPTRVTELIELLTGEGFRHEFGGDEITTSLELFHTYGQHHAARDICQALPDRIRRINPSSGFTIWSGPNSDYSGEQITCDPDLGDFTSPADENGHPLLPAGDLRRALDAAFAASGTTATQVGLERLDRLIGGPWRRHIAALRTEHRTAA
jgi:hypothetical protein